MVSKGRQVSIQFIGDSKSLVAAARTSESATSRLGSTLKKVGKAAVLGFAGAAIAGAGAAYKFAEAAVEDEKSATLLAKTLRNTTGATRDQVSAVEDWISKQGTLYGVADDDLRPALQKLAAATGDISKSQKLASLAMDISAGSGKDLQTVTTALARAQTGSLTGLGKLGAATKDADGKARSLADITDDLSKKWGGSAAAAADTASGKFERLQLAMSETAESIGYKLLPYANDLGDWLLKDGVPALENFAKAGKREVGPVLQDLSGWISDNKDEISDLAHTFTETAIPAIRTLGGLVGDAVGFFSKLPGPIKAVGAEATIAAVAVPKLSQAIDAVSTTLGVSTTKLSGWRKGMLLAAGTGGLVAISEGARTGNKAVSLLGAAMTGAFVGGTLGSAIPGVGTAIGAVGGAAAGAGISLFKMHKAADQAGESAKSSTPEVDGLKESLNQVSGAATRATKSLILQKLQQDGVVTSASQLGIATSDLIKASLGNNKAVERVNAAWSKNQDLLQGLQNQKITDWIYGMRLGMDKAERSIKDTNAALDGTDRKTKKAGQSLQQVGKQRPATDKWTALFNGDLDSAAAGARTKTGQIAGTLKAGTAKAKPNLQPFNTSLQSQLAASNQVASRAGVAIGTHIKTGVTTGLSGLQNSVIATVNAAIAAAQARAHSAGGGGGGKNGSSGSGPVQSGPSGSRVLAGSDNVINMLNRQAKKGEIAGNAVLNSIARGIKKGERTVKAVLGKVTDYIQDKTDRLTDILSDRDSFVSGFRDAFSSSIFGATFSDSEGNDVPPTVQKMLDFAKQQQATAKALAGNVKSLIKRGVSNDLLTQIAGQGQSGIDQIAALATATDAQLRDFNATNSDTKTTLSNLGLDIYNQLNPGVQTQIDTLNSQLAMATESRDLLAQLVGQKMETRISGTDIVLLIKKQERKEGKKHLASS